MCGITGFSLNTQDREDIDAQGLMRTLLYGIENRGKHATGITWYDTDENRIYYNKQPVDATKFMASGQNIVDKSTPIALGHTRHGTQGSPLNGWNNHPIMIDTIIGVHNGMIDNDYSLFTEHKELKRQAEVDSEIIFQLLAHTTTRGKAALDDLERLKTTREALEKIRGSMAIGWIDTNHPLALNLALGSMNPLVLGFTKSGSIIFSSTKLALESAERGHKIEFDKIIDVEEGTLLAFDENQNLVVWDSFNPLTRYRHATSYSHYDSWSDSYGHYFGDSRHFDSTPVKKPETKPLALTPPPDPKRKLKPYQDERTGRWWYPTESGAWTTIESTNSDEKIFEELSDERPPEMIIDVLDPKLDPVELACIRGMWENTRKEDEEAAAPLYEVLDDDRSYELLKWVFAYRLVDDEMTMDEEEYDVLYETREARILSFYNDDLDGPHRKPRSELHGYARPGDEVETSIDGETCRGVIVAMPQTYPLGDYVLSVQKPYRTRTGIRWESQLVYRQWFGFTLIEIPDEIEEQEDAEATTGA